MKRLITIISITLLIAVVGYIVGAMFKSFNPREWTIIGQLGYMLILIFGVILGNTLYEEEKN
jgi:putative Mn2+ efflux pump MntP